MFWFVCAQVTSLPLWSLHAGPLRQIQVITVLPLLQWPVLSEAEMDSCSDSANAIPCNYNQCPGITNCKSIVSTALQKNLSEDQVAKETIDTWEREQSEYKKKLIIEDTQEIIAMVSGDTRKLDGREFYIGGVDISFIKGNKVDACSCLTIVQMSDLQIVYQRIEMIQIIQPYIPGYLAFREVPPMVDLYKKMMNAAPQYMPDVIMVDGNGTLHPRGFGLACHLGVVLDVPTLGVAKTLISAQGIQDNDEHKQKKQTLKGAGKFFDMVSDTGAVLGRCIRTCDKAVNPTYVSVGHKITLDTATQICLKCSRNRIPEPVRKADIDSRDYVRQKKTDPYEFIKGQED